MIRIAGRQVQVGDALYHSVLGTWGNVKRYDASGSAELIIQNSNGTKRTMLVRDGGIVNGKRVMYWHEPLKLDLPVNITEDLQKVVDANVEILKKIAELNYEQSEVN